MPHTGQLMTRDEYFALDWREYRRTELEEGVFVLRPSPSRRHQRVLMRLSRQIDDQLPPSHEVFHNTDVILQAADPSTIRQPDLVVTPFVKTEDPLVASDILLAVEIMSPETRELDLGRKAEEYADAGIPYYWVVDIDSAEPSIAVFNPGANGYVREPATTGRLTTTMPGDLTIDINALLDDD